MIIALAMAAALATPPTTTAPDQSPQDKMDALQQVYDESCGSRGYGEYDDVCNSIRKQIREAERELRKRASTPRAVAPPDAANTTAAAPAADADEKPQAASPN